MARGRMISRKICTDKAVNALSSDTCRLAFTWAIAFADVEGRIEADPELMAVFLFPRRPDVDSATMAGFTKEWHDAGIVVLYEVEGETYGWFPSFTDHQKGLRRDREAESTLPPCPAELLRSSAGVAPEQVQTNSPLSTSTSTRESEAKSNVKPKSMEGKGLHPSPDNDAEMIRRTIAKAGIGKGTHI